eukprot:scaffold17102_cov39-Tisochrysis_lutea.AAC.4
MLPASSPLRPSLARTARFSSLQLCRSSRLRASLSRNWAHALTSSSGQSGALTAASTVTGPSVSQTARAKWMSWQRPPQACRRATFDANERASDDRPGSPATNLHIIAAVRDQHDGSSASNACEHVLWDADV